MKHDLSDYFLVGPGAGNAVESKLVSAEWYHSHVPRYLMKQLIQRKDGPALRDTALWLGGLGGFALLAIALWESWSAALPRGSLAAGGVPVKGSSRKRFAEPDQR